MKLDLDQILTNAKGEPWTITALNGDAVYRFLVQWREEKVTLTDAIAKLDEMAGGKDRLRPLDLGDLLYRSNENSPKMGTAGSRSEKRARGALEEKLVKRGIVDFDSTECAIMQEDCELFYGGAVLIKLDRIFAQALLDAAPKPGPELVKGVAG
jgi:hypothetical protein